MHINGAFSLSCDTKAGQEFEWVKRGLMATPNIPGTDKQDSKTRSKTSRVLGFFKPDLGTGPTQVREVHSTFLLILATLFASVNILSRDHPYLKAGAQFTLGDLFATTLAKIDWKNKQQLPQTVFFCAVWGLMASMVLYLVTAVLLFVATPSHAYAQDTGASGSTAATSGGMFSVPENDLAQQFLHNLVMGKPVEGIEGGDKSTSADDISGLNNTGPLQGAFRDMLKYYSSVILIIASFMVLYHIIMLIVNSAWSGKPLEGANQIWGPLRLAIAIGLLVPLSNGLNSGQYVVLKAAEVGSAAGTKVWNVFSDSLSKRTSSVKFTPRDDMRDVFVRMILVQACMYDIDFHTSNLEEWIVPRNVDNVGNEFAYRTTSDLDACGTIRLPDYNARIKSATNVDGSSGAKTPDLINGTFLENLSNQILKINHDAGDRLRKNGQNIARRLVNFQYINHDGRIPANDQSPKAFVQMDQSVDTILHDINSAINQYYVDVTTGVQRVIKAQPLNSQLTNNSWILAGAYYLQMAMYQHTVFSAAKTNPTAEFGPIFSMMRSDNPDFHESDYGSTNKATPEQEDFLKNYKKSYLAPVSQAAYRNVTRSDAADITSEVQGMQTSAAASIAEQDSCTNSHMYDGEGAGMNAVVCMQQKENARTGEKPILSKVFDLNKFQFISSMSSNADDPFGSFVTWGQSLFSAGLYGLLGGLGLLAGAGIVGLFAGGTASAIAAGASWVMIISFYVVSLGMLLCILLPLVPVIKYLGGVVTWLLAIMEAIIGMPLFALAHLTPGGQGLLDPARQGYVMLFHIALRPMLLVFGMIVSLIIISLALFLLNAMFIPAITTAWGNDDNGLILAIVMFSVWAVSAYKIVQKIFSYMDYISHSTMRWLGGNGYQFERYQGEADAFKSALAFQQVSSIAKDTIGRAVGFAGKDRSKWLKGGDDGNGKGPDSDEGTPSRFLPSGVANAGNAIVATGGGGFGSGGGIGSASGATGKATFGPAGKPKKGQPTSNVSGGNQFGFGGGAVATGSAPVGSTITSIGPNGQAQPKPQPGQPRGKGFTPAIVGLGLTTAALTGGVGAGKAAAATPGFVRGAPTEQLRMNEMDAGKPTESGDLTGSLSMTGARETSPKLGLPKSAGAQNGINPGMIGAQGVSGSTAATGGIGDTRATSPRLGLSGAGTVAGSMAQQVAGLNFNRTQYSGGTRPSGASPVSNAAAPATGQGAAARPGIGGGGAATSGTPQQTTGLGFNRGATDTAGASGLAGAGYTAGSVAGSIAGGVPVGVAPANVASAPSSSLQNAGVDQGASSGSTAQQFFARDGAPSATYGSQAAEAEPPLSSLEGAAPAAEMNIAPTSGGLTAASTPAPAPAGSGQGGGYADFNAPNTIANAGASPLVGGGTAPASFGAQTSQGTVSVGPAMPITPDVANAYSTLNLAPTATQAGVSAAYQTMVTQNQSTLNAAPEGSPQYTQAMGQAQQLAQANNTLINSQGAGSAWLAQPTTTAPGNMPAAAPAAMTPVVDAPIQTAPQSQVNVAIERDNQGRAQGATITTPVNSAANPAAPVVAEGRRRNIEPASLRDRTAQNQTDPKKPKDS